MNYKDRAMLITTILAVGLSTGCSSLHNSMEDKAPSLLLRSEATFDILGPVEASAEGAYLFRVFGLGIENKTGCIGSGLAPSFYTPVQKVAVYNAIESMPEADAIIAPRWEITRKNKYLFFYVEEKVTLKAKAIRFNTSNASK